MTGPTKFEGTLGKRFRGMAESIGPMCRHIFLPPGPSRFPVGREPGYRTCRKEHALPIVRDEFRPAIPRRVARQRCPSPLHRHHQGKTIAAPKGIIYHRTVTSVLTVCLTPGDKRTAALSKVARCHSPACCRTRQCRRCLAMPGMRRRNACCGAINRQTDCAGASPLGLHP
jgi:hypothetical protein